MTIEIYSIGDIKKDLYNAARMFESEDTLGGINSRHIKSLEQHFYKKTKRHSILVSSCTNGIYLCLKKLNPKSRYVIIPPITFFGIASCVVKAGYIPLYSRVDKYGLMDVNSVVELIDEYQAAVIIPSHINNRYVDLSTLNDFNLDIIEDAAPGYGIKRSDNSCLISDTKNTSVISFSYGKPLTAGEGGMIFTEVDDNWYRGQRYCGLDNLDGLYGYSNFNVTNPELKLSSTAINAVIVMNKLRTIEKNITKSKDIAKYYDREFGELHENDLYLNGNHQTYIITSEYTDKIMQTLSEAGIKSYKSHRPIYYNDAFNAFKGANRYKSSAENYFHKVLHIPCRYDLSDTEVNYIADTVKKAFVR